MSRRTLPLRVGTSEKNTKRFLLDRNFKNPTFSARKFANWPDAFEIKLDGDYLSIKRTDNSGGWGAPLVVDVEFDLESTSDTANLLPKDHIKNWIVYEGGICPACVHVCGGDPNAVPSLDLKIQQRPGELAELVLFLLEAAGKGEKIEYYAEIGACSGGTTRVLNEFLYFKENLIIDDAGFNDWEMYYGRGPHSRGINLGFIPRIEIIGSSMEKRVIDYALNLSRIHLFDVLFIDGDHAYDSVKQDTINYIPIARNGGYVVFHDTASSDGVVDWVKELETLDLGLKKVKHIAEKDEYTNALPDGVGITIFQKV